MRNKYRKVRSIYSVVIIMWGLLVLLAWGASGHRFNASDSSFLIGVIMYGIVSISCGGLLLLSGRSTLLRIASVLLLFILQLLHAFVFFDFMAGGDLYMILWWIFLLFVTNFYLLFGELGNKGKV